MIMIILTMIKAIIKLMIIIEVIVVIIKTKTTI